MFQSRDNIGLTGLQQNIRASLCSHVKISLFSVISNWGHICGEFRIIFIILRLALISLHLTLLGPERRNLDYNRLVVVVVV